MDADRFICTKHEQTYGVGTACLGGCALGRMASQTELREMEAAAIRKKVACGSKETGTDSTPSVGFPEDIFRNTNG